jgi:hypothetical protein
MYGDPQIDIIHFRYVGFYIAMNPAMYGSPHVAVYGGVCVAIVPVRYGGPYIATSVTARRISTDLMILLSIT